MKTRTDFVSNSSSSSFVVAGPDGVGRLAGECAGLCDGGEPDVPYGWSDMRIRVSCRVRDYKRVSAAFGQNPREIDWPPAENRDPSDTTCIYVGIYDLLKAACSSPDVVSGCVEEIWFSTEDDYDEASLEKLRLLYRFFDATGCRPDASDSERDFMRQDGGGLCEKMVERMKEIGKNA